MGWTAEIRPLWIRLCLESDDRIVLGLFLCLHWDFLPTKQYIQRLQWDPLLINSIKLHYSEAESKSYLMEDGPATMPWIKYPKPMAVNWLNVVIFDLHLCNWDRKLCVHVRVHVCACMRKIPHCMRACKLGKFVTPGCCAGADSGQHPDANMLAPDSLPAE